MHLTLGQKLVTTFVLLFLFVGGYGFLQLERVRELKEINSRIVSHDIKTMEQLVDLVADQDDLRAMRLEALARHLMSKAGVKGMDAAEPETEYRHKLTETRKRLQDMMTDVEGYARDAASPERGDVFRQMLANLRTVADNLERIAAQTETLFTLAGRDNISETAATFLKIKALRGEILQEMKHLHDRIDNVINAGQAQVEAAYRGVRQEAFLALVGLLTLCLVLAILLQRSIVPPLRSFMAFAETVGRGELASDAVIDRHDEVGQLGRNLNQMVAGLREVAKQTRSAAENLNAATAEIRASTQEQAASVEEQLAAIQETSATLDEITQSGIQIATRAREAAASAETAVGTGHAGLHAAEDATRAMDAIREQAESVAVHIIALSEKTQAIGEIIITVNDIAERSHLLALNAAIEAAAAGEHGRSFAVVAAEIKNLADQAKDATSQVRTILVDIQRGINASVMLTEEAVKRVAFGKDQTDTTQKTIHDMSDNMQVSVQTFQQIVAATNQHQIGLEQVMLALQNIRVASKQTADGTRQLDGAAANVNALSQQLSQAVSRYRL
ncbi:MAG: methyl-accepting chemotaxis protein [Alphaproteobacteria bacterium]